MMALIYLISQMTILLIYFWVKHGENSVRRSMPIPFTCQYVMQLHPSLKAYGNNITKGTKSDHTTFKILIRVV